MLSWWAGLGGLHRTFYIAAIFFSTLFVWQLWSAIGGLGGGEEELEADTGADADGAVELGAEGDDYTEDASGLETFRLLSVRSILAFGTLFSWAGALYLGRTLLPIFAVLRAFLWGLAGMVVVALFFWLLPRLTEEGTSDLRTAIGQTGTVYLNIPEDGAGQVRVMVSGALQYVRARSRSHQPILAGTPVRVVEVLDSSTLEVEQLEA
ncbi:MAG: hypothetical protein FJZ90_16260 [Chloroflexi bacterium]|nr:hypothetical protein [Chloroflexota bacterium]